MFSIRALSVTCLVAAAALAFPAVPDVGTGGRAVDPAEQVVASISTLQLVHELELAEYGVRGPTGLAWSDELDALVIGHSRQSQSMVFGVAPDEYARGRVALPARSAANGVAVAPTGTVATVGDGAVMTLPPSAIRSGNSGAARPSNVDVPADPDGVTYDGGGLVLLDAGTLVRPETGATSPVDESVADHDLRGLAWHAQDGELYTYDATAEQVLVLSPQGAVRGAHDAGDLELLDVRGLAFGPSADSTDEAATEHLYLADAGTEGAAGMVYEVRPESELSAHIVVGSSEYGIVQTSSYSPPSPDPSGLAYDSNLDRLDIVDGEVEEMSIFRGVNLYRTTRAGVLDATGVTQPWSNEPVGAGYDPVDRKLLVSDDSKRDVFFVTAGSDGRYGTSDDSVTTMDTAGRGNTDPEGVDYDPVTRSVWLTDGVDAEVFRARPGGDGRFGTSDDVWSNFDVGRYGASDPEGMAYDAARDTIAVLDGPSDTIYELAKDGSLLNTIDISVANVRRAAGLAVAPRSSGSGRSYYVAARGVDNDSNPDENDGRLYEFKVDLGGGEPGPVNAAPVVSAGPDLSVTLPGTASLDGSVTDDGLPAGSTVQSSWSKVSGPGTVSFSPANAPDSVASFSAAGTYVLRLTATDGALSASDDVTVTVNEAPSGGAGTFERRISAGSDDAEQRVSGSTSLTSSDLELTTDGTRQQVVALRFGNVQVPKGATVTRAYVQFTADEVTTGAADLVVRAEATDNAATYAATSGNVTSRTTTSANVSWTPPDWTTRNVAGTAQRTPDLSGLVQAVVSRSGWAQGNAVAFQVSGTGRRTAEAFEGSATAAPLLHVEFTSGSGEPGPVNAAPVVSAGPDLSVTLPGTASLDGSVTDDGLPAGSTVQSSWSKVSGPGTVSFSPANAPDSVASFSAAGTYVLRLTATDGALSASDDVTVTVSDSPPPGGSATLDRRISAGSDDAEQRVSGSTDLTSSDLELTTDGTTQQVVGLRFGNIQVPKGATVTRAYVQFTVDEVSTGAASLVVRAEAADNAVTYATTSGNVTSRATTSSSVSWTPPDWAVRDVAGTDQRTPDLSALVQAVVSRSGWAQGNAIAFQVSGTGRRTAEAFEGVATAAPLLHVEWTTG